MESRAQHRPQHVGQTHADYPTDWLNIILAENARRCLAEAGEATTPLGVDSSGVETSRYEEVERPGKKAQDFVQTRQKEYL
ncbi:MAG: hypothetical protein F4097_05275 [Cenarchaeum sp. SB0672_bin_9]|nr:hypothetical protein [Cenarchaeum sp. SB0672_bin_9]